ncbi:hypothetical protein CNR22_12495 [Sphingobacteriaceae bacterium]|nr:hypothetical protein CNR22_12495 [Sphingobacteriaceae bacterium]
MQKIKDNNLEVYNSKQVVNWYKNLNALVPVEKFIFEKHGEVLKEGTVLDIGIGGGRTTRFLYPLCKKYTGIDYSANFVKEVNKLFTIESLVMDARDLSTFKDSTFDFVNFSFNGIDYVDADGRKKILSEVFRVLKPKGIFFFSTHNKNHPTFNVKPWLNKSNSIVINIKTFLKLLPFLGRKLKSKEIFEKDFAIINDSAHDYSLQTFYTSPAYLRTQLDEAGFTEIEFFTKSGEKRENTNLEDWIFATAIKDY